MNLAPRKRYTLEFKAQAVELLRTGKPVTQVAEELCISSNLLYSWRQNSQGAQLGSAGARAAGGAGAPIPPPRRWHAARKAQVVLRLLRGESLDALSRELALPISRLEAWHEEGLAGLHAGLSGRPDADPLQLRLDEANRRIGELSMDNELLRIKADRARPFPTRRSLK